MRLPLFLSVLFALSASASADLPAPPKDLEPWATPMTDDVPGVVSAADLLDKPAGRLGPVVARSGHFFTGDQRIRFWGVNICFGGCFPTHEQADRVAGYLARFGINAVRFHHMDNSPFPRGIFSDRTLEKLSPEALDRLDYFIAALKRNGIYSNLNLHVSRTWSRAHNWPNADKLESFDKLVDIFHPELIQAQKQYARDLLHHVNAYTKTRYAEEPAVAMVEITNEDTLFLWGGENDIANMPDPYGRMLTNLWNQWLLKKYGTRDALFGAWSAGVQPLGQNFARDVKMSRLGTPISDWRLEQHANAKAAVSLDRSNPDFPLARIDVQAVSGTAWHLQFNQAALMLKKGSAYTLSFRACSPRITRIDASIGQAHDPWRNLGLSYTAEIRPEPTDHHVTFIATEDDENARISFSVGREVGTIFLGNVTLRPGGLQGLENSEDPANSTVARPNRTRQTTAARSRDWYDFLQSTDEKYFVEMRRFLREDLGVKCPITGTIGLGPLGTLSQSKMDFVDAHSYWEHPQFPGRPWDPRNWLIGNKPMVDSPSRATLWGLAATRVADKPFTVTEYNHSAPNEWEAECIPMIATFAALQDWDGIFIFSYTHSNQYERTHTTSFFDIAGNPRKLTFMPLAARLFLGQAVAPLADQTLVHAVRNDLISSGSRFYNDIGSFVRQGRNIPWEQILTSRLAVAFDQPARAVAPIANKDPRISWTTQENTAGTGQYILRDAHAIAYAGFPRGKSVDLGPVRIEKIETPFVTMLLVPADPKQTIDNADRLLLAVVARGQNTGTQWDAQRRTIADHWGAAPPLIEVVKGSLSIRSAKNLAAWALGADGKRLAPVPIERDGAVSFLTLGSTSTLWYEIIR